MVKAFWSLVLCIQVVVMLFFTPVVLQWSIERIFQYSISYWGAFALGSVIGMCTGSRGGIFVHKDDFIEITVSVLYSYWFSVGLTALIVWLCT